jgi:hypothetical protein
MDGPSRFAFPPHACWRTLNVGDPPPQRLTEYMLVVTTSVATAAADNAAVPVSSSQSVILIVFRLFHAHTVWPRSPIRAVCSLVVFLLVVSLWPKPSSSAVLICRSPQTTTKPDARSTLGEEGSTLRLTATERRLKLHTPPESQSRIGITAHLLSPTSLVAYEFSLLLSHTHMYIYMYIYGR